ncbi:hypothetical protein ACFSM7_13140 [Clavibacter michiganensis subsp. tessellarius]|uniref:hypothetical protein n=1 Tax=Clavibacter tessellarius TaxID=31965 RepID=UPI003643ED61
MPMRPTTASIPRSPARVSSCFSLVIHSPRWARIACAAEHAATERRPAHCATRPWRAWPSRA